MKLASVLTPTHNRHDLLLQRCIPSVLAQTYGEVEHVVVSDRDPVLRERIAREAPHVRFVEINDLWRNKVSERSTGSWPWFIATQLAFGDYIAFLGDDDAYLPHHLAAHIDALEETGAAYSISRVAFFVDGEFVVEIGDGKLEVGHLDADGIVGRATNFQHGNWRANGSDAGDFDLVRRWHGAALVGVFVPEVTAHHHDGWLKAHPEIAAVFREAAAKNGQVALRVAD